MSPITFSGKVHVPIPLNSFLIALVYKYTPLAKIKLLFKLIPFDCHMNIKMI